MSKTEEKQLEVKIADEPVVLKIKRLTNKAKVPAFFYPGDACFDLYAAQSVEIPPHQSAEVMLGIASEFPDGYEVIIRPRSGLAFKDDLQTHPGTIDSGYRGQWVVKVFNLSTRLYVINLGDRIAQGALRPVPKIAIVETDRLGPSARSEKGIGSSGK